MSKSRGSARRGVRGIAVATALVAVCGAAILGSAGTASAGSQVFCSGTVQPKNKKKPGPAAIYNFACSEDIRAYSMIFSKQIDFFGSETNTSPDTSQSAIMQCGGSVPSFGFGCGVTNRTTVTPSNGNNCGQIVGGVQQPPCKNRLSAGNFISSDVGFLKSPCDKSGGKLRIWVTAVSEPLVTAVNPSGGASTSTVGEYSSEPWPLKIKGYKKCGGGKKH